VSNTPDQESAIAQVLRNFLRDNVQPLIDAAFARIAWGSHVLWQALPLPKVDATTPANGHVGAVQPDGTTIGLDPATGIIGLVPPLVKGNILRANVDGSNNVYWEQYPLSAGNQGDVLTNDQNTSGLPIWQAGAGGGGLSGGTEGAIPYWHDGGVVWLPIPSS
jgi:hypothetical protein